MIYNAIPCGDSSNSLAFELLFLYNKIFYQWFIFHINHKGCIDSMKKYIIRVFLALVLILFLWRIYALLTKGSGDQASRSGKVPVAVEVEAVRYGPIQEIQTFTGTIMPIYQYIVAPKVSGRVTQIRKRIGDWVKRGEVIVSIDDAEYQQDLREAEANLKIAQASLAEATGQLELASQELERVQSLQLKGIASPSELDAALTNYNAQGSRLKLAQAQVEQREASLQSARIRLGYTRLVATGPGFIGERFVDEGSLLAPNSPVLSVIGIDTVIVKTSIIEKIYGLIKPGQACGVQVDAYPLKQFQGKVARIAPMLKETSRVAEMEVEVVNDSLFLKPGMFARVKVVLAQQDSAQLVPSRAIVSRNSSPGLFTVKENEAIAHYHAVQTGIMAVDFTEIISPKLEGRVITLGQHLLEDSSPVILPGMQKTEKSK